MLEQKPTGAFARQAKPLTDVSQAPPAAIPVKEDFKEPSINEIRSAKRAVKPPVLKEDQEMEESVTSHNKALNRDNETSIYDDPTVNVDDLALVEKLLFDGYAETDVSIANMPDKKFTICTTSASELDLVQEIMYDICKEHETSDDRIDMPQTNIKAMNTALFIAISYRGMNQQELSSVAIEHLNTIKKAVIKVDDLMMAGDLESADKLRKSLKKALRNRAMRVRRLPTPILDFLSNEKYKFDKKIEIVMSTKNIIPKS